MIAVSLRKPVPCNATNGGESGLAAYSVMSIGAADEAGKGFKKAPKHWPR
jgi:hypothetical protein